MIRRGSCLLRLRLSCLRLCRLNGRMCTLCVVRRVLRIFVRLCRCRFCCRRRVFRIRCNRGVLCLICLMVMFPPITRRRGLRVCTARIRGNGECTDGTGEWKLEYSVTAVDGCGA